MCVPSSRSYVPMLFLFNHWTDVNHSLLNSFFFALTHVLGNYLSWREIRIQVQTSLIFSWAAPPHLVSGSHTQHYLFCILLCQLSNGNDKPHFFLLDVYCTSSFSSIQNLFSLASYFNSICRHLWRKRMWNVLCGEYMRRHEVTVFWSK